MRLCTLALLSLITACATEGERGTPFEGLDNGIGGDAGDEGTDGGSGGSGFDDGHDDGHADDGHDDGGPGDADDGPHNTDDPADDDDGEDDADDSDGPPVDDNCYAEPLYPSEDVSDIVNAYGGGQYKAQVIEAMERRWPAGAYLLQYQINDSYWGQFSDSNSWSGMVNWLDTLVHEETHLFNAYHAIDVGELAALYFREDKILYLPNDQGFARSEILSELIPEAQAGIYAGTYLTGSQGDRAFNPLLDEAAAYVNEVPGLSVFGEYFPGQGLSLRDGAAAFLYYIEVYLRVGRTNHPDWYDWAKTQPVYVEAVELLWLRTHFFYEQVADDYPSLGISDDMYRQAAYQQENLDELEMFTGKRFEASSCWIE